MARLEGETRPAVSRSVFAEYTLGLHAADRLTQRWTTSPVEKLEKSKVIKTLVLDEIMPVTVTSGVVRLGVLLAVEQSESVVNVHQTLSVSSKGVYADVELHLMLI
jgi:hypothetical protein